MRGLAILALSFVVALGSGLPAAAERKVPLRTRIDAVSVCSALTHSMRAEFATYRANRASARAGGGMAGSARMGGHMRVGITILPRGETARQPDRSKAFQVFRRKQFMIIAQMRRSGCGRGA